MWNASSGARRLGSVKGRWGMGGFLFIPYLTLGDAGDGWEGVIDQVDSVETPLYWTC